MIQESLINDRELALIRTAKILMKGRSCPKLKSTMFAKTELKCCWQPFETIVREALVFMIDSRNYLSL